MNPEIIIIVEGGAVTNVVTRGNGIPYRIIDIDQLKAGEPGVNDYEPDATGVDIEKYTKETLEELP